MSLPARIIERVGMLPPAARAFWAAWLLDGVLRTAHWASDWFISMAVPAQLLVPGAAAPLVVLALAWSARGRAVTSVRILAVAMCVVRIRHGVEGMLVAADPWGAPWLVDVAWPVVVAAVFALAPARVVNLGAAGPVPRGQGR